MLFRSATSSRQQSTHRKAESAIYSSTFYVSIAKLHLRPFRLWELSLYFQIVNLRNVARAVVFSNFVAPRLDALLLLFKSQAMEL